MTIEKLETAFAKLLDASKLEKNIAFLLFKKKLVEHLNIGDALKVKELGVFQLKEQPRKDKRFKIKKVIIFSPEKSGDEKDSLFLTLEVETRKKKISEFDEKVFSVGIGKPILPIGGIQSDDTEVSIEEKISNIISESEKLENFDLWDDYLEGKQSTNLIDVVAEDKIGDLDEYLQDENMSPEPNDFIEIDEDELLADFENSELIKNEELEVEEIVDEPIEEVAKDSIEEIVEDSIEESELNVEDIFDEETNEILEEVPIETEELISDVENIETDISKKDDVEIENEFYDDAKEEVEEVMDEIKSPNDENINSEKDNSKEVTPEINNELNNINEKDTMAHPGMNNFKKGYSPTIIALLFAFFIVGAIGIYYLFFDNPTWLYDSNEVELALSEKHSKEFEEAKRKALLVKSEDNNDEPIVKKEKNVIEKSVTDIKDVAKKVSKKTIEKEIIEKVKKSNTKKSVTTPKVIKPKVEKTKVIKKVAKPKASKKVSENIFFDGTNYSVQISSWRKKSIADKEVKRLIRKGHSAFVLKAYIPKFKANYHRVRIGEISSLEKARTIKNTVK